VNGQAAVELLEKAQKLLPNDKGIAQELEQAVNLQKMLEEKDNEEEQDS
jgi:hypothetical protein